MKTLLLLLIDEYHAYMKFNVFLHIFKKYNNHDITVLTESTSISILTETDNILIFENNKYQELTDKLNTIQKERSCKLHQFDVIKMIPRSIIDEFDNIITYNLFTLDIIKETSINLNFNDEWFSSLDLGRCYFERDIPLMRNYMTHCKLLCPTKDSFDRISEKYRPFFSSKTYIIITRNYRFKQPNTNTTNMIPNLEEIIKYLTERDIKIANVGFPPSHLHIQNDNYAEISDHLSQDELISLFYLSNGILLSGENGGYIIHSFCNIDIFLIGGEWGSMGLFKKRKDNQKTVSTIDMIKEVSNNNKHSIYDILLTHKKESNNIFDNNQKNIRII